MQVTLSEFLALHGDKDIEFQNLDKCLLAINVMKAGHSHVTFGTTERCGAKGTERLGLIVWLHRDRAQALANASEESRDATFMVREPTENERLRMALTAQMRITAAHMRKAGYSEQDILDSTEQARAALNNGG